MWCFTQPGRKGNGEKLVYTANDGSYVLTGTEQRLRKSGIARMAQRPGQR